MNDIPWPALFADHRRYLWSVCYRMTGDVQDAEDLVQATFERAMQRPPEQLDRPWRPWLTRVATNLAIDLLRRRDQQAYDGPWLPAPVEELLEVEGWTRDGHGGDVSEFEVRYGQLESARLAFLLALETLDPRARAVLILRDVLGYSGREIGDFLGLTGANVRVILHRARKALEQTRGPGQDERTAAPDDARVRATIERFMAAILAGDPAALSELLAEDARICTDAGGEFLAARKVVTGRDSVTKLLLGITKLPPTWTEFRQINGEPGLVMELPPTPLRTARRAVVHIELVDVAGDEQARIGVVQVHLASRKLVGVDFTSRAVSRQ